MSKPAIDVQHLGKRYRLGEGAGGDRTLVETLSGAMRSMVSRPRRPARRKSFWALRDVSLRVEPGEVMGIIGRNGAGKSTLLKILSRITEPTRGRVELRGRVASLLEVGTGFHPELTGRENIYLNGAILGMSRREVRTKFDAIVEFSGVEQFLDTPVKRYSSGMRVRLAFAVAAHLDPEILIVDEVLAVGDAAFQQRCLGKMQEVATQGGRTVLFVSHNMDAVASLCQRLLLLEGGRKVAEGSPREVVERYLNANRSESLGFYRANTQANDTAAVTLIEARVLGADGQRRGELRFGEPFTVCSRWRLDQAPQGVAYALRLHDAWGRLLFAVNSIGQPDMVYTQAGVAEVRCHLPHNVLVPGRYHLELSAWLRPATCLAVVENSLQLNVTDVPYRPEHRFTTVSGPMIAMESQWSTQAEAA